MVVENAKQQQEEELRRICIKYKINNPIVGDELYDPEAVDTSK